MATRRVVIAAELPQKEPLRQYTTLHLNQDEDAGNENMPQAAVLASQKDCYVL